MKKYIAAIIAIVIVLVAANSFFIVREGQDGLLLQFGRILPGDYGPGLHFKLPLVQDARIFDSRILTLDAKPERYFTSEKKSVDVDFYVKWRIADVATFLRATNGDQDSANQRLAPIVKDALRFQFNARPLDELIAGGRKDITRMVRDQSDKATRETLGIQVVDVRIKRIDLPEAVSDSVYNRMRAERLNLANELRATGKEAGEKIRADADRQRQVLLADANGAAAAVRGEGDAKAAAIYASAYSKDPEFYAFYRSMSAYHNAFNEGHSVLIMKPGSGFMKYFDKEAATRR
ncbi:MAG TPA: protease modulator HflC [Rhodanobacteraceae bacterium]|nr:protease modulator HflC [Rhodanobacteraceae bacterium]